jgi:peptidoglycan/LPS O-acetylase OafA/YrhL
MQPMPTDTLGAEGADEPKPFLAGIESVRGIAALYVAFGHTLAAALLFDYKLSLWDQPSLRDALIKILGCAVNAQTAVVVFFVISGLVIGRSLDNRRDSSKAAYLIFLVRRGLRLYPAHIVATFGVLALAWLFLIGCPPLDFSDFPKMNPGFGDWFSGGYFDRMTWRSAIATFALQGWMINLVVWSLYVEIWVAPLLPLFHAISRRQQLALDLGCVAALLMVALVAPDVTLTSYWFVFYLGMMVETHGRRWAAFLCRRLGGVGPAVAAAYLTMALPDLVTAGRPPLVVFAEAFGAYSIISLIVWRGASGLFDFLEHPLLRWNGRLSYSFYLWHLIMLTVLAHWLYATVPAPAIHRYELAIFIAVVTLSVALALGVAELSYRFVERPFIKLGYALESGWRPLRPVMRLPQMIGRAEARS